MRLKADNVNQVSVHLAQRWHCVTRHVIFMQNFKKYADRINAKYAAEICGNTVQNCLKPTTPSRSTGIRTHGWCHSVGNQMVEVTKPNRNTNNIKMPSKMPIYAEKYAICAVCWNMQKNSNKWISVAIAYMHKIDMPMWCHCSAWDFQWWAAETWTTDECTNNDVDVAVSK